LGGKCTTNRTPTEGQKNIPRVAISRNARERGRRHKRPRTAAKIGLKRGKAGRGRIPATHIATHVVEKGSNATTLKKGASNITGQSRKQLHINLDSATAQSPRPCSKAARPRWDSEEKSKTVKNRKAASLLRCRTKARSYGEPPLRTALGGARTRERLHVHQAYHREKS